MRNRLKVLATALAVAAGLIVLPAGGAQAANCDGDPGSIHLFSWVRAPIPEPAAGATGQTTAGQPISLNIKCAVDPSIDTNLITPGANYISVRFFVGAGPSDALVAHLSGIVNQTVELRCRTSLTATLLSAVPDVYELLFGSECYYGSLLIELPPGASLLPGTVTVTLSNGASDTWRTAATV